MRSQNNKGFTLVEILVALALSAVVLGAIYSVYVAQQKVYVVQEEVAKMQQNLRAALLMMSGELRMAGFDPTGKAGAAQTHPRSFGQMPDCPGDGAHKNVHFCTYCHSDCLPPGL